MSGTEIVRKLESMEARWFEIHHASEAIRAKLEANRKVEEKTYIDTFRDKKNENLLESLRQGGDTRKQERFLGHRKRVGRDF